MSIKTSFSLIDFLGQKMPTKNMRSVLHLVPYHFLKRNSKFKAKRSQHKKGKNSFVTHNEFDDEMCVKIHKTASSYFSLLLFRLIAETHVDGKYDTEMALSIKLAKKEKIFFNMFLKVVRFPPLIKLFAV